MTKTLNSNPCITWEPSNGTAYFVPSVCHAMPHCIKRTVLSAYVFSIVICIFAAALLFRYNELDWPQQHTSVSSSYICDFFFCYYLFTEECFLGSEYFFIFFDWKWCKNTLTLSPSRIMFHGRSEMCQKHER